MKKKALDKQITIEGKFVVDYRSITIKQYLHKHHSFTVVLDLQTIEKEGAHTIDKSKDWLGKKFTTNVYGKAFVGIILDVSMRHNNGGLQGEIILKGASQTILLETGKQQQSWVNKDLVNIVNDLLRGTEIRKQINPLYTASIPYQCQYLESNFAYLQRLAHQYNEWFYFNGVDFIFGKPKPTNEEAIIIEYPSGVTDLEMKIQTYQPHINTYNYESLTDKVFKGDITGTNDGLNELANASLKASKNLYKHTKENAPSDFYLQDKSSLDDYLKRRMQSITAQGNMLAIKSSIPNLRIGTLIKVNASKPTDGIHEIKKYGEYIIIEITHQANTGGEYTNSFKAIPASVKNLPINLTIKEPIAHTQIATVINNEDPQNKGRVQVQFQWQKNVGLKTNWLRVMTPNAGSSNKVATNRGFVFIPEKGDQVLISFEYNDPSRPFVLGSLFTGKTGKSGEPQNIKKSITTRSGNTLVMNDKNGSITITDASNNTIMMKGNGEILIHAPNKITFTSNDISLLASNSISMIAKPNEKENTTSSGIINILAKKAVGCEVEEENILLTAAKDVSIESKDDFVSIIGKTEVAVNSNDKVTISGKEVVSTGSKENKIIGGKVRVNKG